MFTTSLTRLRTSVRTTSHKYWFIIYLNILNCLIQKLFYQVNVHEHRNSDNVLSRYRCQVYILERFDKVCSNHAFMRAWVYDR